MKKALIVISVSVLLIIMAGPIGFCGKPNDPDPRFANSAMNVINSMKAGDYQNAVKDFNAPLRSKATPESLSKEWSKITNMLGPLKDCVITHGEPETGPDSIYGIYFTCRFKRGMSVDGVIKFDADGKIAYFKMHNSRRSSAQLQECLLMTVAFVLLGAGILGLCRLLRLNPVRPKIENPKRSAVCALIAVSAIFLMIYGLMLITYMLIQKHGSPQGTGHEYQPRLLQQQFVLLVYFVPMALALRLNSERLQSVGLTRANLGKATVVGLILAAITLLFAKGGPGSVLEFTPSRNLNTLIYFSFVGFGEEILFRGYLQSRLVAWRGMTQGWVIASVIMALVHLPQRIMAQGMNSPEAIVSSLALIPVSLFAGFVMLRTGNVVAPGLFHTFANWVNR